MTVVLSTAYSPFSHAPGACTILHRWNEGARRVPLATSGGTQIKIFGIGLSRTGTRSLASALQMLGYRALHFPSDHTTHTELATYIQSGASHITLSVLDHYDALTDTPVCYLYQASDRSYAEKKLILTVRDKDAWLRSCERHWNELLPVLFRTADPDWSAFARAISNMLYGTEPFDRAAFAEAYERYHSEVFQYFHQRAADLLILDSANGEGWTKLAPFVGKVVPTIPFPVENRAVRKRTGTKTAWLNVRYQYQQWRGTNQLAHLTGFCIR